jgi:cobyrinic acid a,c-diamide synthase
MVSTRPRVVVAGVASGCGKTTVATGLMAALGRAGDAVAPFKAGPDYIDPGYHALATGRPGRNLDPVLVGPGRIAPLFAHGVDGADVAVVEGVMGLFDGRVGSIDASAPRRPPEGSTAHLAELLGAPVVLVVDARGQGQSLAALLHGFRSYSPSVRIGGVVLNGVGSERHERLLTAAAAEVGLPVLGALPRDEKLVIPSRHLGLCTAVEHGQAARDAVTAMGEVVAAHLDLDAVTALAGTAAPLATAAWDPAEEVRAVPGRPVVALAGGAAFTFGYAEHAELLAAAGAEVTVFDPLADERLPAGTAAVVVPGGFPEQYAAELSANAALRDELAAFAAAGGIVHAECAGLLYLAKGLDGMAMCGVLDVEASMTGRVTLGYRDAVAAVDSPAYRAGERVSGHEFHRTALIGVPAESPAWHWRAADETRGDGAATATLHASYLHLHPAGAPRSVARIVAAAASRAHSPTGGPR